MMHQTVNKHLRYLDRDSADSFGTFMHRTVNKHLG